MHLGRNTTFLFGISFCFTLTWSRFSFFYWWGGKSFGRQTTLAMLCKTLHIYTITEGMFFDLVQCNRQLNRERANFRRYIKFWSSRTNKFKLLTSLVDLNHDVKLKEHKSFFTKFLGIKEFKTHNKPRWKFRLLLCCFLSPHLWLFDVKSVKTLIGLQKTTCGNYNGITKKY